MKVTVKINFTQQIMSGWTTELPDVNTRNTYNATSAITEISVNITFGASTTQFTIPSLHCPGKGIRGPQRHSGSGGER